MLNVEICIIFVTRKAHFSPILIKKHFLKEQFINTPNKHERTLILKKIHMQ